MQPYQSFSAPPMPNPYQNYNPPMQQNPYLERLNQLQQYQQQNMQMQQPQFSGQSAQAPGIIGRIVNDFSEITANDVPMNGNAAFFPKADGSELQVRSWASDGTIKTVSYIPNGMIETEKKNEKDLHELINEKFSEISNKLEEIEKGIAKKQPQNIKKDVAQS